MPIIKNKKSDLRASYSRNLKICIIITIALFIAAFKFTPTEVKHQVDLVGLQDIIKIEDILNTVQNLKPPKPPVQPKIIETSIDDITEDLILEDIDFFEDAPTTQLPLHDRPKVVEDDALFRWVEEMPEPIGGIKAIQEKV